MRTLVIDTATEACSCAVFDDGVLVSGDYVKLGRGHAERLIPMIQSLPDNGKADAILVNSGPGSFTGLRVGLSAAKALALAWNAPVSGYNSLALVAAMALADNTDAENVDIAMHGGHGEHFVQHFGAKAEPLNDMQSLKPDAAAERVRSKLIAGSSAETIAALTGNSTPLPLWPDARSAFLLPARARDLPAEPVYGRAPDAKPMAQKPATV